MIEGTSNVQPYQHLQKPRKGRMRRRAGARINDRPGNVREPSERFGLRRLSQAFPALKYATVHQKKSDGSCRIVKLEVWCELEASFLLLVALSIYTLSNAPFFSYSKKRKNRGIIHRLPLPLTADYLPSIPEKLPPEASVVPVIVVACLR